MTAAKSPCIFCGGIAAYAVWPVTDMFGSTRNLCRCPDCGTWYYDPQPTAAALEEAYSNAYYGESETKFKWGLVERVVDFFRTRRAQAVHRLMGGKGRALDVGCGNGRFLHKLAQQGHVEVFGTELPGNSAERAKQYPEIALFVGSFAEATFPPAYFDIITLFHVFEHLPEPAAALSKMHALLKPEGILVLSFPNIKSWQAQVLKQHWLHLDPPRHLFFPEPKSFIAAMKERGFALIHKKYFSPEQNPVGMVQGILNRFSSKRDVLFERMKGNHSYAPEFGKKKMMFQKIFFVLAMPFFMLGDVFESTAGAGASIQLTFKKSNC